MRSSSGLHQDLWSFILSKVKMASSPVCPSLLHHTGDYRRLQMTWLCDQLLYIYTCSPVWFGHHRYDQKTTFPVFFSYIFLFRLDSLNDLMPLVALTCILGPIPRMQSCSISFLDFDTCFLSLSLQCRSSVLVFKGKGRLWIRQTRAIKEAENTKGVKTENVLVIRNRLLWTLIAEERLPFW